MSKSTALGRIMPKGCKYCGSKIRYESYMYEAEERSNQSQLTKHPLTGYCTTTCCVLDVERVMARLEAERLRVQSRPYSFATNGHAQHRDELEAATRNRLNIPHGPPPSAPVDGDVIMAAPGYLDPAFRYTRQYPDPDDTKREQMITQSSCRHSEWGHRDGHVVCKLCGWRCYHQSSDRGCCTVCGVGLPGGPPKSVEVPIAIDWTKNRRKALPKGSVKPHTMLLKEGKTYTLKKGR